LLGRGTAARLDGVRYLVVIPPNRTNADARVRDLNSDKALTVGDPVLIDELVVRVRTATDVSSDGYDGTLVCTPDD
jgi:hypothetical protein